MTHQEIKRANLVKMGMTCDKCHRIYNLDHPMDFGSAWWYPPYTTHNVIKDTCNNTGPAYYSFRVSRDLRNYNHFKIKGQWYQVRSPLVDLFIQMHLIEDVVSGVVRYPTPVLISRQVDIFTLAEKLNVSPPLNKTQQKRAQTKAFVERIKK